MVYTFIFWLHFKLFHSKCCFTRLSPVLFGRELTSTSPQKLKAIYLLTTGHVVVNEEHADQEKVITVFADRGFTLHKWHSNHPVLEKLWTPYETDDSMTTLVCKGTCWN